MKIFLQLIENYAKQEVPTLILTIDKDKYIFNIPSCFQRFIRDHKQKFPKGSNIFFTKASADTIAGLSGFMLTIFQSGICVDTKLFLNEELYCYMEEMRYKMGFKILPYSYSNLFSHETRTGVREIETVMDLVRQKNFSQIFMKSEQFIHEKLNENQKNSSKKLLNEKNEFYDGNIRIIPFEVRAKGEKILNYICIPNKLEGKVLKEKLTEFKVPPKEISKLLSQGSLMVDGKEVLAEQIKEPDSPSPNFLILHYNSIASVKAVL